MMALALSAIDPAPPGEYRVTVDGPEGTALTFEGYADNPTDALYKALEKRNDEYVLECRE